MKAHAKKALVGREYVIYKNSKAVALVNEFFPETRLVPYLGTLLPINPKLKYKQPQK